MPTPTTKTPIAKRPPRAAPPKRRKSPPKPPPPPPARPRATASQPPKKKKGKKAICVCLIIFVVVVVLLILALVGLYFAYEYYIKPNLDLNINGSFFNNNQAYNYNTNQSSTLEDAETEILGKKTYRVWERVILTNVGSGTTSKIIMNMALIQDIDPYQVVMDKDIFPDGEYEIITDEENNQYARFETDYPLRPGERYTFEIEYEVQANMVKNHLGECEGEVITDYLSPDTYIESDDAEIVDLAYDLTWYDYTLCDKARTLYDYVGDNVTYTEYMAEEMGALWTLHELGGDCTHFSDLYAALARAEGIPTRFVEGLTYKEDATLPEDVKHDWTESYLPGVGWTPMDTTWGQYNREKYFSQINGEHIIVTRGRNLETLDNNHYFYYQYWWDCSEAADLEFTEEW